MNSVLDELGRSSPHQLQGSLAGHLPALPDLSLITMVGTLQAVAAEKRRLECMVPADDATELHHADFMLRHRLATASDRPDRPARHRCFCAGPDPSVFQGIFARLRCANVRT